MWGAVIGSTGGVGESAWVDSRYGFIFIVDIGGEISILGPFMTSMGLFAATSMVTALSSGRSVSTATAI